MKLVWSAPVVERVAEIARAWSVRFSLGILPQAVLWWRYLLRLPRAGRTEAAR